MIVDNPLKPDVPTIAFEGVTVMGEFAYADVSVSLPPEADHLGCTDIIFRWPIQIEPGQSLDSIREWAIARSLAALRLEALNAESLAG